MLLSKLVSLLFVMTVRKKTKPQQRISKEIVTLKAKMKTGKENVANFTAVTFPKLLLIML